MYCDRYHNETDINKDYTIKNYNNNININYSKKLL